MRTLVWWTTWGLVVGIGLFGLRESGRLPLHLILSVPLLSGAAAAAMLRLRHEYHEALQHAKWLVISSVFLLLGTGYLYVKTEGYGPFSTGTTCKAFLGTTFEMSEREVERALGRTLAAVSSDRAAPDSVRDWLAEILPTSRRPQDSLHLSNLVLYGMPATAEFDFMSGKLGKVELHFEKIRTQNTAALLERLREDFSRTYQLNAALDPTVLTFHKESVQATVARHSLDEHFDQVQVDLDYLPFAAKDSGPLTVTAQAF